MSHPRIEEVSDSDDDISDPSEGDIDDFKDSDILRAIPTKPTPSAASTSQQQQRQQQQQQQQQQRPGGVQHTTQQQAPPQPGLQPDDIKDYQMLYPVYFDASRSRAEGRRVPASLAVSCPLAREVANACAALRLSPVLEAHRAHPRDWANPGRVRVALKAARARGHPVANKHHLYVVVARYLREHPTTDDSPALRQSAGGGAGGGGGFGLGLASLAGGPAAELYADGKPWPRPAVPRGWKIPELLPAHSAAMTGGGVSENAFKDMMREMQGAGGGAGGAGMGMPGMNADMMSMLQGMGMGMGGGGGGPAIGGSDGGGGGGGGGKKGKKGKGK
ncbi:putative signal recognition particle subunit SRP19 [Rosellinia necatrix]|uniref:Putative signal recognition particle subunit SRP19 n=1 Tax=Rosellinia necatrix TaxID=77044 RepID=A0A1W2TCI4_ROSNE|nr:putative signal recognition particle subunit SRP19 [Rosellinia necatrix]